MKKSTILMLVLMVAVVGFFAYKLQPIYPFQQSKAAQRHTK
jgi:hypothetical protein